MVQTLCPILTAARYCADLISHCSAIKISYYRGVLAAKLAHQDCERHSMLSVGLCAADLVTHMEKLIDMNACFAQNSATISCINSPSNVTVAAPQKQLGILKAYLDAQGVFVRQLQVKLGYHSPQMRQISSQYVSLLDPLEPGLTVGKTRMVSSVTGSFLEINRATDPTYWDENMVSQVNFAGAANLCFSNSSREQAQRKLDQSHLEELTIHGIVEIGPHSTLKAPLRQILDVLGRSNEVFYVSALARNKTAQETFLNTCGRLYCENSLLNVERLTSWCRTSSTPPKVLTQVPKYPFDHSVLYWEETRRNQEARLKKHVYNKFLGVPLNNGSQFDARWRLILRTDEQPWIKDHVINGANVYPGAGMLVMALEATKQLLCEKPPKAFIFENVEFISPILLSDTSAGTEVEISLVSIPADKTSTEYKFRIGTWRREETWEEVCHGSISPDYGKAVSDVDLDQDSEKIIRIRKDHESAQRSCNRTVDDFYGLLRTKCGAEFGPSFRRLENICANDTGDAIAAMSPYGDDCVVHPVVLDAVLQVGQAMVRGSRLRTMVPRRVRKMWIATSGVGHKCFSKETIHARAQMPTRRTAICSISVLRQSSSDVALTADDFEFTAVSEQSESGICDGEVRNLTAHMLWKPDFDLLTPSQLGVYCNQYRDTRDDPVQWFREFEVLTLAFTTRALLELKPSQRSNSEYNSYISWSENTIALARCNISQKMTDLLDSCISDNSILESLSEKLSVQKAAKLYTQIGTNLTRILARELDPLAVIFKDEQLLVDFYNEMLAMSNLVKPVQTYVDVLVHKRPYLKFLEIGAGTGGTTEIILEILEAGATPRYTQYVFTDIGPSFLERACERFSDKSNMQFRPLDIEKNPLDQGFLEHEFDVIVADKVLHATSDLSKILQHIRKLLKPGGKLIMNEITTPNRIFSGFVFGLLPGWWLSTEKGRQEAKSPCVDETSWNKLLKSNQFTGADLVVRDYEAEVCHGWSFIFATATETSHACHNSLTQLPAPVIVAKKNSRLQAELTERIADSLKLVGTASTAYTLEDTAQLTDLNSRDLIVILESEEPILVEPTSHLFENLQKVLCSARSIVWVTQSSYTLSPEYGIITGLARVLRTENSTTQIVTFGLEVKNQAQRAVHISAIFEATQQALKLHLDAEPEYWEQSSLLHINRIVPSKTIDEHVFRRTAHPVVNQAVGDSNLRLGIRALGLLDTLEFSEETAIDQELAPNEVLVRVHSIGVNFKDCLTLLGRIDTDALGSECAGTVVRAGSACKDIMPGARVVVFVLDAYRSFIHTTVDRVTMIPDWMSFSQAASILTAFCTAHFSLINVARLREHEKILIHAGAGGTGQAAIQIAQSVGAQVFVTVGSLAKKQLLMDVYGISESSIFYSRDASFADRVMEVTHGEGVDVILNSLAGKLLQASWETIAHFGRFVEIGRSDIDSRKSLPMYSFRKNASFIGVDLTLVLEAAQEQGRQSRRGDIPRQVMDQVNIGTYKPVHPIHEYDIGDAEEALRFLQSGKSAGKIVVNVSQDSIVPVSDPS
jgi:NADPH:quinone reductase-like Zn-dependent oxidoreductase/ubiquinone/menaquinone biosynthesis C-methylase UbiE